MLDYQPLLLGALAEANAGLREGGLPIGSVLADRNPARLWREGIICVCTVEIRRHTRRHFAFAMRDGGEIGQS